MQWRRPPCAVVAPRDFRSAACAIVLVVLVVLVLLVVTAVLLVVIAVAVVAVARVSTDIDVDVEEDTRADLLHETRAALCADGALWTVVGRETVSGHFVDEHLHHGRRLAWPLVWGCVGRGACSAHTAGVEDWVFTCCARVLVNVFGLFGQQTNAATVVP